MEIIAYITPSFYSSVHYWRNKEDGDIQELYDLIDKKPVETTELMQAGIDFEDDVARVCGGDYVSADPVANEIASIVKGCLWQEKISVDVDTPFGIIRVYGRMDCVKRDWIYDIKNVRRYEMGKYFDSIQHLAYMKATGIKNFKYLVKCGTNCYYEEYREDDANKNLLAERVTDLIWWLKNIGLYDRYLEHWGMKNGNNGKDR